MYGCDSFEPGKLYFRYVEGKPVILFFTNHAVPSGYVTFDCHALAINDSEFWSRHFETYTFTTHNGANAPAGQLINYMPATDDEIRRVFIKWGPGCCIKVWLDCLSKQDPGLHPDELARLNDLLKSFL